jgi:hypothetical protein
MIEGDTSTNRLKAPRWADRTSTTAVLEPSVELPEGISDAIRRSVSEDATADFSFVVRAGLNLSAPSLFYESETVSLDRASLRDRDALIAAYESDPVEDGVAHLGDRLLSSALERHGSATRRWILDVVASSGSAAIAASLVKSCSRTRHSGSTRWKTKLVAAGLRHSSVEVRDAAVQAAELWSDKPLVQLLLRHEEPVSWLRDYISNVVQHLTT